MKVSTIRAEFVEFVPEQLDDGVLYISERYKTASHKCCCGCGEEVVTPLGPADWSIRVDGDRASVHPSIGNWNFKCRSHYVIRRNQVVWAGAMKEAQIAQVQVRDRVDKQRYIEAVNKAKEVSPVHVTHAEVPAAQARISLLKRAWLALTSWR
jgi:hypothetical protein